MDGGIITLQGQNRHIIVWNNEHTEQSVIVLLRQIVQSFKNVSCIAHVVVSTVVLYLPLQHAHRVCLSI